MALTNKTRGQKSEASTSSNDVLDRQDRVRKIQKRLKAQVSANGAVRMDPVHYWEALKEANEAE